MPNDSADVDNFDAGFDWAMREIREFGKDPITLRVELDEHLSNSRFDQGALIAIELMRPDGYQSQM